MYHNIALQPAFASKFATSLREASIWNALLSKNGSVYGIKIRITDDNKANIRKIYDSLTVKSSQKRAKSK